MQEELSAESLERINAYMDQYHIEDRSESLLVEHGTEVARHLRAVLHQQ